MDLREKTHNENRHPWELSRADGLFDIIKRYDLKSVADIGSGDRFFISKLKPVIGGAVYAVDAGYTVPLEDINGITCLCDIALLPPLDGDSGIIMMDVLEHVSDDAAFLCDVLKKLPRGGYAFVTVPAFRFLFSAHDRFLKHHRRYERKRLLDLLHRQNLRVIECRYFYIGLFFARTLETLLKGKSQGDELQVGIGGWKYGERHILTRIVRAVLDVDFYLCGCLAKLGIYPPGLSLLAVCRKL